MKMKNSVLAFLSITGSVCAKLPSLSLTVTDGNFGDVGGFEPTLSWSTNAKPAGLDLSYGIEVDARPTSDLYDLPKSLWGAVKTNFGAWGVSAKAEFKGDDFSAAVVEIDAVNEDLSIHVDAVYDGNLDVEKIEATKTFSTENAAVTLNPRYDAESRDSDVVITYDRGGTSVEVTASKEDQSITVSQQIDDDNRVAPTLTSNGDFTVEWEKNLGDDSSITTTLTPNEAIDVEWHDGGWDASINLPLKGTVITGVSVGMKKNLTF